MIPVEFAGPGRLVRHEWAPAGLAPRFVDVWLPPDLPDPRAAKVTGRTAVYCHDGQNAFVPELAFGGVAWDLHTAALAAADAAACPAPVVVAIWNAGEDRYGEYLPPGPELAPTGSGHVQRDRVISSGGARADAYLQALAGLVPTIEKEHELAVRRSHRVVLGSSMGGLAALYCTLARPDLFPRAGCVSTNFIVGGDPLVDWFAARLPRRRKVRLWFDRGTEALDAEYGPTQERMDAALRASRLREGREWVSRVYEGADHSERAWATRASEILEFLLRD